MALERVKIVLDADVIIHFSKGGLLSLLPQIFPEYEYIVLDKVYNEIRTVLKSKFGDGESACMAYCRYTANIIGSSNLNDIKNYCTEHKITYLTTLDFLYYAWCRNLLTEDDCATFIKDVVSKGSKLPMIQTITQYVPNARL